MTKRPGCPAPTWLPQGGEDQLVTLSCYAQRSRPPGKPWGAFFQWNSHLSDVQWMVDHLKHGRVIVAEGTLRQDDSTLRGDYIGVFKVDPSSVRYDPATGLYWVVTGRLANV